MVCNRLANLKKNICELFFRPRFWFFLASLIVAILLWKQISDKATFTIYLFREWIIDYKLAQDLLITLITVDFAYLLFVLEEVKSNNEKKEEQFETLKNFMFDMNSNFSPINSLKDHFCKDNIPYIKNKLMNLPNSDPFKPEVMAAVLEVELNQDSSLASHRRFRKFIESLETSCQRHNKPILEYLLPMRFTFNIHLVLLHSVFNNFKQFDLPEFKDLRDSLLRLRSIYDVYWTNIDLVLKSSEHEIKEVRYIHATKANDNHIIYPSPGNVQKYINSAVCLYKFTQNFSEDTYNVLKILLDNKVLNTFFLQNEAKLGHLHNLHKGAK